MEIENTIAAPRELARGVFSGLAILAASLIVGFALFSISPGPRMLAVVFLGVAVLLALLLYPELGLALYVVIGDVKGDERVAALLPWDLTLALGGVLIAGIILNFLRKKRCVAMPPAYFLFVALVALMVASLSYTPVLDVGLEKVGRFLTVTGIVIVAPFFVLGTARAMKRFLIGFAVVAFVVCAYSLQSLGGSGRLVTPSSNTIGLGHIACGLILILWFGAMPRMPFLKRILIYPLLAVPALSLIGSGSRGAALALGAVILLSLFFHRALVADLLCLAALGFAVIPFVNIPVASFEYLGTLVNSTSVNALLFFRAELLSYGWKLLQQHPLLGVGIQGFRYYSPNAGLYNWPHNIFLEVCCELGLPAGIMVMALFGSAVREAWRQLRDRTTPYLALSQVAAALLAVGIVNATNTGDINSDRSTWLFLSLVFVMRGLRNASSSAVQPATLTVPGDLQVVAQ